MLCFSYWTTHLNGLLDKIKPVENAVEIHESTIVTEDNEDLFQKVANKKCRTNRSAHKNEKSIIGVNGIQQWNHYSWC